METFMANGGSLHIMRYPTLGGRFTDTNGVAIKVRNISWIVPPVKNSDFAIRHFEAAIGLASKVSILYGLTSFALIEKFRKSS